MVINSLIREKNFCGIVASTPEHVYNAWMRVNTLHLYVLSNDKITDVIYHFTARIEKGDLMVDGDELINMIGCAFPDDWHDIMTILETLLYTE